MRIAYVEDNVANLALVERVARMNQHTIVSFSEGEVAIQELVRQKFDLILMDVELAGEMGGLQVVQHLRGQGITTPIVAVTAYAMMGDRERFLEAGCNDYLPKPLPIAEFLVLLARYDTAKQAAESASQAATQTVAQVAPQAVPQPIAPAVEATPAPVKDDAKPIEVASSAPVAAPAASPAAAPITEPATAVEAAPVPAVPTPAPVESATPAPAAPAPAPTPEPVPAVEPVRAPMAPLSEEDTATKPIPRLASLRAAIRAVSNPPGTATTVPAAPQTVAPPVPSSEPVPDKPAPSNDVPPTRVP